MNTLSFTKSAAGTPAAVTHAKLVNRIQHYLDLATVAEHADGLSWYAQAGEFCGIVAGECGFRPEHVAQCTAILSPQITWDHNKRNVVLLATTLDPAISIFAGKAQKQKALAALLGEYALAPSSRKTYSFAENIADPASLRVTVDRHAVKAALNDHSADSFVLTDHRYSLIEKAYQTVAQRAGLFPYQIQAVVWVAYKRVVNR